MLLVLLVPQVDDSATLPSNRFLCCSVVAVIVIPQHDCRLIASVLLGSGGFRGHSYKQFLLFGRRSSAIDGLLLVVLRLVIVVAVLLES